LHSLIVFDLISLGLETCDRKDEKTLSKYADNSLFNEKLNETSVFFSMFNELPHIKFGWFIQPFHISITVSKPEDHTEQNLSKKS